MRIFWLDNLKALGIFLVVFGHMIPVSRLQQYIYSFHMPLFFFVSGYLFDQSKYNFGQFFRRRFSTLIIPYLFFATLCFLFWFFIVRNLSIAGKSLATDPLIPLIGIFYGVAWGEYRVPMSIALWFLPCLFVLEIVFYFVRNRYFLLLVFAIIGYIVTFLPFRLPWGSDVALTGIVFYGMGHFYKDTWTTNKALPFLFAFHFAFCFLNTPVDMNGLVYGNIFYFYISACSGVLFYSALCKFIKKNMILEYVGSNTIIFVGLVEITWFIMNGISYLFFRTKLEQTGLGFTFAASIVQIGLTIPAIYFINTWFPFILGKPTHKTLGNKNK